MVGSCYMRYHQLGRVSDLSRKMSFACICSDEMCNEQRSLHSTIHSNKIQISEFAEQTTSEDLRIRFSVYGSIKNCYFVSHLITNRHAYITFHETFSAIKAVVAGHKNIYLHGHRLRVCEEKKELTFDLNIVPGNTLHINDDCMLKIFEYLSIGEIFKLKKVCTRWCTMANKSLQTIRHLDLEINLEDLNNFDSFNHEKQLPELLRKLDQLKLQTDTFLSFYRCHDHDQSKIITSLNMHLLAMGCTHLTKLTIRCSTYDEHILSCILTVNKELRCIQIFCNPYITGESLIHLSEKIHTFVVDQCKKLESNHLCAALKRLKNLKYLKLIDIAWDVVNIFNEHCQNLETLILVDVNIPENFENFDTFLPVTNLKNLRKLRLFVPAAITETFIVNLCHNCQELCHLETFCLRSDLRHMSERAMNAFSSLTKLKVLSFNYNGINLANLHGLHKIYAHHCDFQEEEVVAFMRNSPELKYLSLNKCRNITENIFSEARKISASRCNDVILELLITNRNYHACETEDERRVIYNGKIY